MNALIIRSALPGDLEHIEAACREHFALERSQTAYTVFREGVYPTRDHARRALEAGSLYVCESTDDLLGSMILDESQPEEYANIPWPSGSARALVLHLLMVRPSAAGRGVGTALVEFALEEARKRNIPVLRLDTGAQNLPARALYRKLGFREVSSAPMRVGGVLAHGDHLFLECALPAFAFRAIRPGEAEQAAEIEQVCFPPNEACSREMMLRRVAAAPELFLVAEDRRTGKLAGFLNGLATRETVFRDEFFTNERLHDPQGGNVMLLGLDVLPEHRGLGLARELVRRYAQEAHRRGRSRLVLTCLEEKVAMYKKFGFRDLGMANSAWGGERWHEMDLPL